MGEYVPGFHNGRIQATAVQAAPCDLSAIAGYVIGPVFEPEVARSRGGWLRRLIARRRGPAPLVQQIYAYEIDPMVASNAEAALAARQAAEAIAAAMMRLRVETALVDEAMAEEARIDEVLMRAAAEDRHARGGRAGVLPEHLLIVATVVLALGNAVWHFVG